MDIFKKSTLNVTVMEQKNILQFFLGILYK